MLRDIGCFVAAVWAEWKALLTGGSIIAALSIWSIATSKAVPRNVNWLIVGLTLVMAAFLAWRKEWIENGKGFVDASPREIMELVRNVTGVAANSRVKPYLHKWIKVTGRLGEVSHVTFPLSYVRVNCGEGDIGEAVTMMLMRWKAAPFVPLTKGTVVTIAGRIVEVRSYEISLRNITLLSAINPQ